MDTEFRAVNQRDIEFSLTITMTLEEWRRLKDQMDDIPANEFPAWRIVAVVRDMVRKANTHWVDEANE